MRKTIQLHRAQLDFRRSSALYRGFVGGIGSGKSWVGAYDLLRRAEPGRLYMAIAPTYGMIRDATLRGFLATARELGFLRGFAEGRMAALLGNRAEVLFRSADDPERLRGPNLSGIWFDEASLMDRSAWEIGIGRLREGGQQGWASATFTPKGRQHWTYQVFGAGSPDTALFTARSRDNPFNPPTFEDTLRRQYTAAFAEQELAGKFVDLEGTVAKRDWFRMVDAPPRCIRRLRAWDFAATPADIRGDGDYTVGALLGTVSGGGWVILDLVRARIAGGSIVALVKRTAEQDGREVAVAVEQEPGSAGKVATAYLIRELAGWNVRAIVPSTNKLTRAMPLFAQAEAGNISLVRAGWNQAWLDEVASFPGGDHDDQVDAVAHSFNALTADSGGIKSGWVA